MRSCRKQDCYLQFQQICKPQTNKEKKKSNALREKDLQTKGNRKKIKILWKTKLLSSVSTNLKIPNKL